MSVIYELVTKTKQAITQADLRGLKLKENVFIDKQGNEIGLLLETMKLGEEVKGYFPKSYKYSIGIQSLIKSPEQEKEFFKEFEYVAKNKNGIFCYLDLSESEVFYPKNFHLNITAINSKSAVNYKPLFWRSVFEDIYVSIKNDIVDPFRLVPLLIAISLGILFGISHPEDLLLLPLVIFLMFIIYLIYKYLIYKNS